MRDSSLMVLVAGTVLMVALLAATGAQPFDRGTWLLEVAPVLIALPILWATRRSFPLTTLLYLLIFAHAVVLMVGGAYTYARVPAGYWLQDLLHLARNPYDKIGHLFQGFVPALVAREILIRVETIRRPAMRSFLIVCVVMAISAVYELIEWAVALAFGQGATDFLGTQGDPWDAQSDMLCALVGAVSALLLLSRFHDRQLSALQTGRGARPGK